MSPAPPAVRPAPAGPPASAAGVLGWLRQNLFDSWFNSVLTIACLGLIYVVLSGLFEWGVREAAFGAGQDSCKEAQGACWGVIRAMWQMFMVGTYTDAERWRPLAVALLIGGLGLVAVIPRVRRWRPYLLFWMTVPVIAWLLLHGAAPLQLVTVETDIWGGLLLTLVLTVVGLAVGFPLGVVMALGRQSEMPIIRALSISYIELMRGVPLITVLFMASVMLPLFFPSGFNLDKLLRAQVGIILFEGAVMAEVVRGGLQGVPRGQFEAASALGLSYWRMMGLIVMPQALRIVVPAMVGQFISLLKNTSLVTVIGLFDLLGVTQLVTANPEWMGDIIETYVFVAFLYWIFCWAMSKYSRVLEVRFRTGYD